jgi:hypothetical protein
MSFDRELPKPPRRPRPMKLFMEYLPELWQHVSARHVWPDVKLEINFDILTYETYVLTYDHGRLTAAPGTSAEALLTCYFERQSYELATYDLLPRAIRRCNARLDLVWADIARTARIARTLDPEELRRMPGQIEIRITDDTGAHGRYHLMIGNGIGPKATIIGSDDDLWALLDCHGDYVRLLKRRATLEGDVAYVIALALFFEGRLPKD